MTNVFLLDKPIHHVYAQPPTRRPCLPHSLFTSNDCSSQNPHPNLLSILVSTTGTTINHVLNSPMPVMGTSPLHSELEDALVVVLVAAGVCSSQSSSKASRMTISSASSARDVSINLTPIAVFQDRERLERRGALIPAGFHALQPSQGAWQYISIGCPAARGQPSNWRLSRLTPLIWSPSL